jgi:hypothetical protein
LSSRYPDLKTRIVSLQGKGGDRRAQLESGWKKTEISVDNRSTIYQAATAQFIALNRRRHSDCVKAWMRESVKTSIRSSV